MEPTNTPANVVPKRNKFDSKNRYPKQPLRPLANRLLRQENMGDIAKSKRFLAVKNKRGRAPSTPAPPSRRGKKRRNINQDCAGRGDDGVVLDSVPAKKRPPVVLDALPVKKKPSPEKNSFYLSSPDSSVSCNLDYSFSVGSPYRRRSSRSSSCGLSRGSSNASSHASSRASSLAGLNIDVFASPSSQGLTLRLKEDILVDNNEANKHNDDATPDEDEEAGSKDSFKPSSQQSGPPSDLEIVADITVEDASDDEEMQDLGSARRNQVPSAGQWMEPAYGEDPDLTVVSVGEKAEDNAVIDQDKNESNDAEEVPEVALRVGTAEAQGNPIDAHCDVAASGSLRAEVQENEGQIFDVETTADPIDEPVADPNVLVDVVFEACANECADTEEDTGVTDAEADAVAGNNQEETIDAEGTNPTGESVTADAEVEEDTVIENSQEATGTSITEVEVNAAVTNNQGETISSQLRRSPRLRMRRRVSQRELDGLKSTLNGPYWS